MSEAYSKISFTPFPENTPPTCLEAVIFAVALLCAADGHAESVTLGWDPSPDPVNGYTVFYGEESVLTNPSAAEPVGKALTCTIDGLVPGHNYYFAVKAYHDTNESGFSNEATYTVPVEGTTTSSVATTTTSPASTTTTTAPPVCTDNDGDTYGVGSGCAQAEDCDDADQAVNPAAAEICDDGIDNNCNGLTDEDCDGGKCPFENLLGGDNPDLASLRSLRDTTLARNALGRKLIAIYYNNANSLNAALESSPQLRSFARMVLATIAPMTVVKEE